MQTPFPVHASPDCARAVEAIDDLLTRLKLDHVFVGGVARAAWLGETVENESVDVLAVMSSESKSQVAMMAMNRGFEVNRDEVEATDELDLVPLGVRGESGLVRCHVLVASNALYASMVNGASDTVVGERPIRVVNAEDLALMLLVGGGAGSSQTIARLADVAGPSFDPARWRARLTSIGIRMKDDNA